MKLRQAITNKISDKILRAGFDIIGEIALIEIPKELKKRERKIGEELLRLLKNVKTVAVKRGAHKGKYRMQKLEIIAGEKSFITTQKESGAMLKLDVSKCYYSPRLGTERLRIASLVKPLERVLVAGSGIGPYPIIIAKHSKAKEIIGIEINKTAHKYANENIKINKLSERVKAIQGDVKKNRLGEFDRIILAAPHEGVKLAEGVIKNTKKRTFIHVLDFAHETGLEEPAKKLIQICKNKKKRVKILRTVKAGQSSVRKYRVCVDAVL